MATPLSRSGYAPHWSARHVWTGCAVLVAHAGAIWGLQAGWQIRPPEPEPDTIIAATVLSEVAPAPVAAPPAPRTPQPQPKTIPTPPPSKPVQNKPQPVVHTTPTPAPATRPATTSEPASNTATAAPVESHPPVSSNATTAVPSHVTPAAPPAPAKVELPNASASYLNNPKPPYPALSKRLGEEGKVVVRAWIDTNGTATQAEIKTSSGYDRLDQTALQTVLNWRYVPGKRAGVPEAMWFNIPLNFILE